MSSGGVSGIRLNLSSGCGDIDEFDGFTFEAHTILSGDGTGAANMLYGSPGLRKQNSPG